MGRPLLALAALVALMSGCSSDDRVADRPEGVEFDIDAELVVDDDGFAPERLEVTEGDTVELRNEGEDVHRLTSDSIDSGLMQPGDTVTLRFDEPGTVEYHDTEAPEHEGTIVVAPLG